MTAVLRPTLVLFLLLAAITGIAYPLVVTGIAAALFPTQAAGSLVIHNGKAVGSSLIGQAFGDPRHFWSRPSATAPQPYNSLASGGSNLGPLNPDLAKAIEARIAALRAADPTNKAPIPIDLVTASGSGLDPDISLAAANYQAPRIARERGLAPEAVQKLVTAHAHGKWLGILGEPRVNVLELNLALDALQAPEPANPAAPPRAPHAPDTSTPGA
jgi:K+-transporting ATPase ATPase C chain